MWKLCKCLRHLRVKFRDAYNVNQHTTVTSDDVKHQNRHQGCCLDNYRIHFWHQHDDKRFESSNKNTSQKRSGEHIGVYNYCSFFEAVGWGTALLVGLQYVSQKWNRKDFCERHAAKFAGVFLQLSPATLTRRHSPFKLSVLPITSESSVNIPIRVDFETESKPKIVELQNESFNTEQPEKSHQTEPSISAELSAIADECVSLIQNNVGINLIRGKKPHDALFYFEAACELGNSKACFNAGVCHEVGLGTEKNILKAKEFYQKAADMGHATAMYNLGVLYLQGRDNVDKNVKKALELLESAANLGVREAQKFMALHYMESDDMESAIPFITAAVEKNDCDCQYYLGLCYENGWGLEENLSKAAEFYSKAAENGHLDAMYNIAVFNELGLGGLDKQTDVAYELYSKAARGGHVEARSKLTKIEHEKQQNYHSVEVTNYQGSGIHISSSLPEVTVFNRQSLSIAKCLSDNLHRLQKQIIRQFNNDGQISDSNLQSEDDEFLLRLWNRHEVVS